MNKNWQQQLASDIKTLQDLKLAVPDQSLTAGFCATANDLFRLKVPRDFMPASPDGISSPLLLQVLPDSRETHFAEGYLADPVGDLDAMHTPGLIHKYANRALFIVTGACAIHCRYCFRRHFPYAEAQINTENWEPAFNYLREHKEISEIILSGGDPLIVSNKKLEQLFDTLDEIKHIKRLRIHSRIPSVLPDRIDNELVQVLTGSRFQVALVTHINHAAELNEKNKKVFKQIQQTTIQLLNQSVLLAGVNNAVECLTDLSEKLYETGILPYYLHMLDPVQGAAHFSVKEADAIALIEQMTESLPGYLVPKLVREISGERAKTRIL